MRTTILKHLSEAAELLQDHPYQGIRAINMHITLLVNKNDNMVSYGFNQPKTHPKAIKMGYDYGQVHSEFAAIHKVGVHSVKDMTVFNFRFNHLGELRISRPCKICMPWVLEVCRSVVYSIDNATFVVVDKSGVETLTIK